MDLPSQGTPGTFHVRASGTGSHTWRAFSVGQSSEAVEICGVFGRAGPRGDPKERNSVEEGCKLTCQPKSATFQMDFKNPYQSDPGRSALRGEWDTGSGSSLFDEQSPFSGRVQVTGCGASSGGSWRRLRFNGQTEQSVLLLDANGIPRHEALAFGYLKSLAAMGSATLRSLGVQKPWRVLLLGVGLGALPGWFRKAQAKVTAIDLDPVVLRAAQVVGQMPGAVQGLEACLKDAEADTDALRVYCCDGVEFVKAASNEVRYDLLVMDVFDGQGETPEAFLTEDFGQACASVATCCVVNLTCPVPMWEDAHHFNAPSAGKLADAFQLGFQSKAWSVRVAEGQNLILCATRYGAPPELYLANAAEELASEGLFAFDPVRRVGFRRQEW
ncbi:Hypothetical protein (Fragment) [Durusdinium trenchii]|uniref:Spermidine synthase n=1 Tax=Durusdinium trenchii TaxID=1381693 RepID=A0ABP0K6T6_9DINO